MRQALMKWNKSTVPIKIIVKNYRKGKYIQIVITTLLNIQVNYD